MSFDLPRTHLLFVVGPTACGKSDLAVEIAERRRSKHAVEIINCDSIQFFEGVDIGAAKPSADLLARVPHHLVGHLGKGATYTAGEFRRDALRVIETQNQKGITEFAPVGGSGFYIQALEKGMYDVAKVEDSVRDGVASDLELKGLLELHTELARRDPETAGRIQPQDNYRIVRALEVLRADPKSRTMSEIRAEFDAKKAPSPFRVSKIGLFRPRDVLRQKVTERTRKMMADGLIDEVLALRAEGLSDWSALQSVGYLEAQAYLDGKLAKEELEPLIVTSTMQLAKRQMTWFKRDSSIQWFDTDKDWIRAKEAAQVLFES